MRTSTAMEKDAKERLRHKFKKEQFVPTNRAWRTMEPRSPNCQGRQAQAEQRSRGGSPALGDGQKHEDAGLQVDTDVLPASSVRLEWPGRAVPSLGRGRGRREALRVFPRPGCSPNPRGFLISPDDLLDRLPQAQQLPMRVSAPVSRGRGLRRK